MTDFIEVANVDELAEGELLAVEVDGEPICLSRIEGKICAFTDNCTHISGPISEGELDGFVLTCPWHGAQFDLRTGKVLRGPARQDLMTYPVKVEGKSILLSLPDE
ncbi:non-heme iron oxygenase ferredoxin subunit [Ktedonosporobacter rubrisoli]|uniref:Non-heme iron oxygenase ferredoxin subunit n=1 Tax=Ktedonosporobacter rubrisoli TaxID=2509675 RepID=A0A4V0YZR9_KTERU|nr:non-heme iron oxygenase ferredoxin subunit [Ktedonosporobacter rubrisoli]QBD80681.1 non-heme iron oxygenase ferredoxin subunit [Ktedonosporobacter rubrisoli]